MFSFCSEVLFHLKCPVLIPELDSLKYTVCRCCPNKGGQYSVSLNGPGYLLNRTFLHVMMAEAQSRLSCIAVQHVKPFRQSFPSSIASI